MITLSLLSITEGKTKPSTQNQHCPSSCVCRLSQITTKVMKINKIKCPLLACVQQEKKPGLWQYHRLHWASVVAERQEIFLFWYCFFYTCQVLDFHPQNKNSKDQASYAYVLALWRYFSAIQDTVNYIHPSAHLHMSVWDLRAVPWNGNTAHVSD